MGRLTWRARLADHDWRSLRVQTAALLVALALVLGGGLFAAYRLAQSTDQLIAATTAARLQVVAAQQLLDVMQDAEANQRGVLLTSDPAYRAAYDDAARRFEPSLQRLLALGRESSWAGESAELERASRSVMAELAAVLAAATERGLPAASGLVRADPGRTGTRDNLTRIMERAEADRAQWARTLNARQAAVSDIMVAALGAGLVLLGLAALALLSHRSRLHRAKARERTEAVRLQAAVEHVRDGMAVFDRSGQLTLCNARFAKVLGVGEGVVTPGVTLAGLAAAVTMDPPLLADPPPGSAPTTAVARLDARVLEVWRRAMPDGGQMVAIADISRRVKAEDMARQSQKMEVLGQMTGGVAHDFNNLLQVVSANLELLAGRLGPVEPPIADRLAAAKAGVARGARLTGHLLAFARRQPLAPSSLDPGRLLSGMEDMLRRTAGEAVRTRMVVGEGLWPMRADPNQVENALLNLTLNARDAMEHRPAGRLTIEVANAALDTGYAGRNADVVPGDYVLFAVTDTGVGMTPAQMARATEPFYTTKPEGKGTGLGLPMVFGFAKQSGGHFQLYSEPGRGTTARLYIPRSTEAAQPPAAPAAAPRPARGELVLLVEDDAAVRDVAAAALRGLGYTVTEADSADAARVVLQDGCRPALLFTDVVMPGTMTSGQLAELARILVPGIAVLFTSGYTQSAMLHNGQLDPGVSLLSKPWRTEELARAVRTALDGAAQTRGRRVLLVEDDPLVREAVADTLAELGFEVRQADSGAAALTQLSPAPDLLMTDLGLPDVDGLVLARQVRALLPGLPVVVASGREAPREGGLIWLPKPFDRRSLSDAVARALASEPV